MYTQNQSQHDVHILIQISKKKTQTKLLKTRTLPHSASVQTHV